MIIHWRGSLVFSRFKEEVSWARSNYDSYINMTTPTAEKNKSETKRGGKKIKTEKSYHWKINLT
jgi:hypothetical protein